MEKLAYLLWKPAAIEPKQWQEQLRENLPVSLRAAGASRFRLNLVDESISPAASMRQTVPGMTALPDALLTFWLDSAFLRAAAEAALAGVSETLAGYAVAESEPLPNLRYIPAEGERCHGMNHVVFLQTPPRLNRAEWLSTWLDSHSQVAIDTQQTFGYRQNIVLRALTPEAPPIDAIVEENFLPEAMTDQNAFYRQETPEQLATNQRAMYQSCKRFIDFDKMGRLPTSEYNFR